MDDRPLMKCGHAAQGHDMETGKPVCVICVGVTPDADIVDDNPPNLEGRRARCAYFSRVPTGRNHEGPCERGGPCFCERDSSTKLPFFEYKLDEPYDKFYCGCWGWD